MVWLFSCLVLAKASGRAERFSGLVIWLFFSRADARDTGAALFIRGGDGAALLIWGGGALGVETPAHEQRREAGVGRKVGWIGAERRVTEGRKREQRREGVLSSRADARDTMAEWGEGNV